MRYALVSTQTHRPSIKGDVRITQRTAYRYCIS